MLIADIPLPKVVGRERELRKAAKSPEIDTSSFDVPLGADVWVSCCHAWPHVDEAWGNEMFLTLSILSSHQIGDAKSPTTNMEYPRGRLAVVDPLTRHWLFHRDAWQTNRVRPWVGLQWEVPRGQAKRKARELVARLGGQWLDCTDKRYANWRPV